VITSVYGGYDEVPLPCPQDRPCEWVLVTDTPPPAHIAAAYRVVVEPRPQVHPRLAAKVAKCCPGLYVDPGRVTVWIDGNLRVTAPDFAAWCLDALGGAPLAQHRSPHRTGIAAELAVAAPMPKYAGLPLAEQTAAYLAAGLPPDFPVWWTGLIIRAPGCPRFGPAWLAENLRWSYEDQISHPYIMWRYGLAPADLPLWQGRSYGDSEERFTRAQHASNL
jgi:hypothetical protein